MKLLLVIVVLAAIGIGAAWHFTRPVPIPVRIHSVERGLVRATVPNTWVGTVEACERAQMSAAAPGQVAVINVREGATVAAGDILLEIWNEDRKAELRLAKAEATAAHVRSKEACAIAAGAAREAKRIKKLHDRKLSSEEALDRADTDAESSRASCEAGRATTNARSASIGVAREALERTLLRAPFDGVIAEIDVRLGEYLTPSPPGIATLPAIDLINPQCLYVVAPIDEVDAPAIELGMSACVSLDAFRDRRCSATVSRIAPYVLDIEKQARSVEVEVAFSDATALQGLLPGYSADIEILIESHDAVLRIPSEAVVDGDKVFVVDAATSQLILRDIKVGIANWEFTEIVTGLLEGDVVVLSSGREGIEAGVLVSPEADVD
ncbi:MAG: efflux RND transporter periplasmic adaptor subunit [Proteobacteria bacterium]|nr:efflux RND transporter periplasmic adaptor subunit [Pseudomonadota bacterium]